MAAGSPGRASTTRAAPVSRGAGLAICSLSPKSMVQNYNIWPRRLEEGREAKVVTLLGATGVTEDDCCAVEDASIAESDSAKVVVVPALTLSLISSSPPRRGRCVGGSCGDQCRYATRTMPERRSEKDGRPDDDVSRGVRVQISILI